ncbi:hypothetical protein SAMN04488504_1011121 [Myxococcus virescens]|nr:hypothetical protein SAMN04488504_1011121 [Myxococcus virescens]
MAMFRESEEPIGLEGNVARQMIGVDHDSSMAQPRTGRAIVRKWPVLIDQTIRSAQPPQARSVYPVSDTRGATSTTARSGFLPYELILPCTTDELSLAQDASDVPVHQGRLVAGFGMGRAAEPSISSATVKNRLV